jgi:phytanoyl-CoA hydroxylase
VSAAGATLGLLEPHAAPDLERLRHDLFTEGYARVGPVLTPAGAAALAARAQAIMQGEVVHEGLFFQHDSPTGRYEDLPLGEGWVGPSLHYRKIEKLERDPLFLQLIENPVFERVVRAFIPGDVVIYRAVLFNKPASGGAPLPWHQDAGQFWGVEPDPFLQLWTALDPCPVEAGCVEVFPRSHLAGRATPLGGVVPEPVLAAAGAEAQALPLPAQQGESLLIHNHTWHRAQVNRSGRPRRTVTICYMSAETRCLRKKHKPRVFFPVWGA